MRVINTVKLSQDLSALISSCLVNVEQSACHLLRSRAKQETGNAKWALDKIVQNHQLASERGASACQDAGMAVIFADVGEEVYAPNLTEAINEGVRLGYAGFRKSVAHSLSRVNTQTNCPAVIYYNIVKGNQLVVSFLAKGAGSENMSAVRMLTPQVGVKGIVSCVADIVKTAGANPCPPLVLGVGIGGTMDMASVLSKRALIRTTGSPSPVKEEAQLEQDILLAVNDLGIGVQGLGGDTTALAVHVMSYPTHIGMLPVAVTVQCHCVRHGEVRGAE